MNPIPSNVRSSLGAGCAGLLLLLAFNSPATYAQTKGHQIKITPQVTAKMIQAPILYGAELSPAGRKAVTDPERMDANMLLGLLAKEGRFVNKSLQKKQDPRSQKGKLGVTQTHFIVGADGKVHGKATSKPFALRSGTQSMGQHLPKDQLRSLLEKSFSGRAFVVESVSFPDTIFSTEKQFPDTIFNKLKMSKGQIGLVSALVSVDGDRTVQSRPMVLVLGPAK